MSIYQFARRDALTGKRGEIYRYLQQQRGQEVSIHEIAKVLGCSTTTAASDCATFCYAKHLKIRRVRRGVYMYGTPAARSAAAVPQPVRPQAASKITAPLLEVVGHLTDGSVVMRDEHGALHRYAEAS